jgi:hypothetical protein
MGMLYAETDQPTAAMKPMANRVRNNLVMGFGFLDGISIARVTLAAHGRLCLSVDSEYRTTWLSSGGKWRFLNARMWTNTLLPPEEGVMKP